MGFITDTNKVFSKFKKIHYAKWNKLDTRRQILYFPLTWDIFPLHEIPIIGKCINTESKIKITRGLRGRKNGELLFIEYRASVWNSEKFLEMYSADSYIMSEISNNKLYTNIFERRNFILCTLYQNKDAKCV